MVVGMWSGGAYSESIGEDAIERSGGVCDSMVDDS